MLRFNNNFAIFSAVCKAKFMRLKRLLWDGFAKEERAIGVVEMVLILVVLIGLILIFKQQLTSLINTIFQKIQSQANSI